jgi:EAL domain-containing protein (putative c-di-GMP-specific phosphodiesterase class I)
MVWGREITVSVNVSGVQLRDPRRLSQAVAKALAETGLDARRLVLEITESAMFGGQDALVAASLLEFRRLGIAIALDDFGTGYSSLAYLQRLHLDKLKIDQSFVRGLDTDQDSGKIIATIIELATTMGFQTIAEGVEKESQASFLRDAGCHWFQGWLFGKPLEQGEFRDLVAQDWA